MYRKFSSRCQRALLISYKGIPCSNLVLHCTFLKTLRSLLISENCAIKRKNGTERMLEDPQPKLRSVCAKFAQKKGKTVFSLLVFTQLFRTRNKERSRSYVLVRT